MSEESYTAGHREGAKDMRDAIVARLLLASLNAKGTRRQALVDAAALARDCRIERPTPRPSPE